MAKKQSKESEMFYVGLKEDKELKRNVLESMKDILQTLQKFEDFRKVRLEKKRATSDLKRVIKELSTLINKYKVSLPNSNLNTKLSKEDINIEEEIIKIGKKKEEETEKEVKSKERDYQQENQDDSEKEEKPKQKKVEKSHIDKLESELCDIESQLDNI